MEGIGAVLIRQVPIAVADVAGLIFALAVHLDKRFENGVADISVVDVVGHDRVKCSVIAGQAHFQEIGVAAGAAAAASYESYRQRSNEQQRNKLFHFIPPEYSYFIAHLFIYAIYEMLQHYESFVNLNYSNVNNCGNQHKEVKFAAARNG